MNKPKGAIDFTPRLTNNNNTSNNTIPDPRQGFSKTSSTPQQLQQSQLAQPQQQEPSSSILAPKSGLNKTTTSPMPRTSTPAYNPFVYTYSRDQRSEQTKNQFQVQQVNGIGTTNGLIRERGDIFSQPQIQQQSQYLPQQQQYPVKAMQQQGLAFQKPQGLIESQKQQRTGNQQLNEQSEMNNNQNNTNEENKSEVFTSNYRVANTYRPLATSSTAQTYLFQQPNSTQNEQLQMQQITPPPMQYQQQQQSQQQQGVLLFQDSQKKPNGKVKLNKSSKSETPLKPILKDFSMTYKQNQQQQQTSLPTYPQQPQQQASKQTQSLQQQNNQTGVGNVSVAGNSSTKSNSNSTHVALQQLETSTLSAEQQQYGSANNLQRQQGQSTSQWSQEGQINTGQQEPLVQIQQQQGNITYSSNPPNNSSSLQNGSRFRSGHQPQSYQRMMSPKTEPSEFGAASLSSQHFYPSKQRSPTKHSSSKEQNIGKYSSGGAISSFPVVQDSSGFILDSMANTSTTSGAPGSLAIKQTPPHSNNLNGLGLVKRKSQTPKRNSAQSVGGNVQLMAGLGDNNNSNLSSTVPGSEKYPIFNSSNAQQNQAYIQTSTGTNSLTVSGNFNNFPTTTATVSSSGPQNSTQVFSTQNRTLLQSGNSGRNQRAISPIGQNASSDPTQMSLNALNRLPPNQNQQYNQVSSIPFSQQQTLFGPIQEESSSSTSPVRHKKTTSDFNIKEKDPQEMFLIRDQDTGVVYDIRQIDKIDTFSKTNNQEYFDKLKRRHKNAWQGWWNSKKENNLKMLESVRQNNFQIVEQLLQHERADLRADTDFKDPNQWASIHYAAYNGNAGILNLLISHEADMSLTNNLEQTALMIAAEKGYGDIAEICIRAGVNVNSQDLNKNTALHFASRNGNLDCVRVLLRARDINVNLRNVENKLAVECSKTNEISMLFKDSQGVREEKKEPESSVTTSKVGITTQQEQQKRIAPRNSNYENILSQSVLQGFYGQKLTLSSKNGQVNQNQQVIQSKQQTQPQITSMVSQSSTSQPITSQQNQYYQQPISGVNPGTQTSPLVLQQAHINQTQQQQQQPQNGLFSSSNQQLSNNINSSKVSQSFPAGTERVSFEQQIQMQSSNGQGFQSSQLSSSSQSVASNNRSSTYKSGIEQPSPPGGQGMRQSISSQGSSTSVNNSQNHLTDSQLTAFSNSGLYNNAQQLPNQQNQQQQQQPWRVIIHDFPNESIMRMFDNTDSGIYQPTENNNSLSQGSNNSNNTQSQQQQQQSLIYNYSSSSNPGETSQTGNISQQPMMNNEGFGRGSATPQNGNTLVSTNETIINSGSPSHKHHKVHSQDVLPTSAAANMLRKLPSHSTQSSTTPQGIWQQNQQQLQQQQQAQMSQQVDDHPQQQPPKPSEYIGPEQFRIITQIGRGSFGEVYLVEKKNTENNNTNNNNTYINNYFAMKMLHKSKVLGQNLTKYAMTERNVLSIMCHPFIVKLMFAFQTSKDLFLIMEYMPGGDLSHALQRDKRFSESRARIYLVEIMLAIRHLHKHDIIYRDLKPENIVIDAEGHAMLTDFGLSKDGIYDHYSTHSFCGSLAYLAPEMLKRTGHGKAVDYYHLGVLLFEMLTGAPPFFSDTKEEICHNIESQDIRFPSHVSDNARNLISKLLVKNPAKRLGNGKNDFEEMKKHPFFSGINWNQAMQRKLKPPLPFIKPIVDSKNTSTPNFMMTMTPQGMMTDNHINGWSFINTVDQIQTRNNNNFSKF